MGGRGSFSYTHGGIKRGTDYASPPYISQKEETRADIRKLFIDEIGFTNVYGTQDIPTAQLAALGIEIKNLNRKFHVIGDGEIYFATTNRKVKGSTILFNDGSITIMVNPKAHISVGNYKRLLRAEQARGIKTQTNNLITKDFSYTVRHEYGHALQLKLEKKYGTAEKMRNEIQNIAKKTYHAKSKSPSGYGSQDQYEFFAESFASLTGGKPNAHGKAIGNWLKKRNVGV